MQSVKDVVKKDNLQIQLESSFSKACEDKEFVSLVKHLKIERKMAIKMTSKLELSVLEKKNCKTCKGIYMCKNAYEGHLFVPETKEGHIYFSYIPCSFKQARLQKKEDGKTKNIRMKDIDTTDKKQLKVIKWLDTFFEEYDGLKVMKGLYLHGSFGTGKTYLLTALLNELAFVKRVRVEIIYFPCLLRELKENWDNFSYLMKKYQTVDILCIDDLGAEKVTEWGRDEILGTILQTRMNELKTTFFTSNYSIEELEKNLSLANNTVDEVKARRIIERIKQLSIDMTLISEDRRIKEEVS